MKQHLGWAVAGVLALGMAGMIGSGFQNPTVKIGTVNLSKVLPDSEFMKSQEAKFRNFATGRNSILEFLNTYRTSPTADLLKFKELSMKEKPSDADRADMDRLRSAAVALDQKYRDLQTKANPTDEDKKLLADIQKRAQENVGLLQRTAEELQNELQDLRSKMNNENTDRLKSAINEVAAKQGFTVVLDDQFAPYSANDLSPDVLKAMNAKR